MTSTSAAADRLRSLSEAGVSIWLDEIRRSLARDGQLAALVQRDCLRGVTANPSIFERAILGSSDYDQELAQLAGDGLDPEAVYERLAVRDVQLAADVLAAVHAASAGRDGFVSLEVSPRLAHDSAQTLAAARRYRAQVERPNLMIKVPGTPAGAAAIEQAIYEGINVNVTLLFSVDAYATVAEAYIRGLERRHADGLALDVSSVASFFVSRIDSRVDPLLQQRGRGDLAGTAALANARDAYRRFRAIFAGPRWEKLREAGAAVQRPLWASTGTKDPAHPDTMYVDGLIGPDTVNTMPLATLRAFADHGEVPGATAELDPSEDLAALVQAGIDLRQVTDELLVAGIGQFDQAMSRLLAGIEERCRALSFTRS